MPGRAFRGPPYQIPLTQTNETRPYDRGKRHRAILPSKDKKNATLEPVRTVVCDDVCSQACHATWRPRSPNSMLRVARRIDDAEIVKRELRFFVPKDGLCEVPVLYLGEGGRSRAWTKPYRPLAHNYECVVLRVAFFFVLRG